MKFFYSIEIGAKLLIFASKRFWFSASIRTSLENWTWAWDVKVTICEDSLQVSA